MTSLAPCWMSRLEPAEVDLSICPGMAKMERPWSAACPAVMSAPLLSPASTTSKPSLQPLTMRLRWGNVCTSGETVIGNSVTTAPEAAIFSASAMFSGG